MNQFNVSFAPFLPVAHDDWLRRSGAYRRRARLLWRAGAARGCARSALGLLLLALADPSLVREDRAGLKDVVAVVVDQSGSQTIGERRRRPTRRAPALQKRPQRARQCRGARHRERPHGRRKRRHAAVLGAERGPRRRAAGARRRRVHDHRRRRPRHSGERRRARLQGAAACAHHRP